MKKIFLKLLLASITLLLLLAFRAATVSQSAPQAVKSATNYLSSDYKVIRVEDGDTIAVDMNGTSEKVRFIGVDTPETKDPRKAVQCYGKLASEFTKNQINNQRVRLEADELNTNRDRYNRLLRYVYLPDGTLLNAEIIRKGYGFAYTSFPFTKKEEFKQLEDYARTNNIGLWGSCQPNKNKYGGYTSKDE